MHEKTKWTISIRENTGVSLCSKCKCTLGYVFKYAVCMAGQCTYQAVVVIITQLLWHIAADGLCNEVDSLDLPL